MMNIRLPILCAVCVPLALAILTESGGFALAQAIIPPVPHNDPARVIPTVPILTPPGPQPNTDWFSMCEDIGLCADYGIGCPQPPVPLAPEPAEAVWCDGSQPRSFCVC